MCAYHDIETVRFYVYTKSTDTTSICTMSPILRKKDRKDERRGGAF